MFLDSNCSKQTIHVSLKFLGTRSLSAEIFLNRVTNSGFTNKGLCQIILKELVRKSRRDCFNPFWNKTEVGNLPTLHNIKHRCLQRIFKFLARFLESGQSHAIFEIDSSRV